MSTAAKHVVVPDTAEAAMMTFTPIKNIHQHLSAFHVYACAHHLLVVVLLTENPSATTIHGMWSLTIFAATARRIFIR
jgi:hypothetical protein